MANAAGIASLDEIREIVSQIVERFHPARIILFGSYAYGVPTEDSDVDLLVLMETQDSPLHVAATISAAVDHLLPIDIMVMTPQQLQASVQRGGVFATEVATDGIVIYEA